MSSNENGVCDPLSFIAQLNRVIRPSKLEVNIAKARERENKRKLLDPNRAAALARAKKLRRERNKK